jgi:hypothetical protein
MGLVLAANQEGERQLGGTRTATTRPWTRSTSPDDKVHAIVVRFPWLDSTRARRTTGWSIGVGRKY